MIGSTNHGCCWGNYQHGWEMPELQTNEVLFRVGKSSINGAPFRAQAMGIPTRLRSM